MDAFECTFAIFYPGGYIHFQIQLIWIYYEVKYSSVYYGGLRAYSEEAMALRATLQAALSGAIARVQHTGSSEAATAIARGRVCQMVEDNGSEQIFDPKVFQQY